MKKIKLLNPILCTTVLAGALIPLASCSKTQQETYVSVLSSKTRYYMHALESDPYPTFAFELKNALSDGQYIVATPVKTKATDNVTCSVIASYVQSKILIVEMKLENFMNVDDYINFNLKVECRDSKNNNVWTQTVDGLKLIASLPYENVIHNLYESTISEFIEFVKNPHPSNPNPTHTLEDDTLNVARNYLKNKVESLGYKFNRDTYGNMWFDVPATAGYSNYPKIILEGHMDMVAKGFETELEARTMGIEIERHFVNDPFTNVQQEVLQSKGTAEICDHYDEWIDGKYKPTHRATSIGADDGIAIAIVFAILNNDHISHGPLRILFTSDEETGMYGAEALDPSVLDCDYLLCIDGEGSREKPYVVCDGCYGFVDYQYNHKFDMQAKTQPNIFTLKLEGFYGEHFTSEVHYSDGAAQMFGNPDALIFKLLNNLTNSENNKKVEFSEYTHTPYKNMSKVGKMLARNATVTFATDATLETVKAELDKVVAEVKQVWLGEDWHNFTYDLKDTTVEKASNKFLSIEDTNKLLGIFGPKIKYEISHWDGEEEGKQEEKDYPTAASNFSWTEIDAQGNFFAASRGNGSTIGYNNKYKEDNSKSWTDVFGDSGLVKLSIHDPWDAAGKEDLLDLTKEGYMAVQGEVYTEKVRGGVEPAYFSQHRPTIQNSVIGPRLEGIHAPNETLYLETLPGVIKCTLYILENMWRFIK